MVQVGLGDFGEGVGAACGKGDLLLFGVARKAGSYNFRMNVKWHDLPVATKLFIYPVLYI